MALTQVPRIRSLAGQFHTLRSFTAFLMPSPAALCCGNSSPAAPSSLSAAPLSALADFAPRAVALDGRDQIADVLVASLGGGDVCVVAM